MNEKDPSYLKHGMYVVDHTYAIKWIENEKQHAERGDYRWCASFLQPYKTILEIGCGWGHSTEELANLGHNVIAIERNTDCHDAATDRFKDRPEVKILDESVLSEHFHYEVLPTLKFDAVVCWNPGGFTPDKDEVDHWYMKGDIKPDDLENIINVGEGSEGQYKNIILEEACIIANERKVPVHLVDRCGLSENDKQEALHYLTQIVSGCCPDYTGHMEFRETYNDPSLGGINIKGSPDGSMLLASILLTPVR